MGASMKLAAALPIGAMMLMCVRRGSRPAIYRLSPIKYLSAPMVRFMNFFLSLAPHRPESLPARESPYTALAVALFGASCLCIIGFELLLQAEPAFRALMRVKGGVAYSLL